MDRLDEIRARCDAATPGPWRYMPEDEQLTNLGFSDGGIRRWDIFGAILGEKNGEFIARSREDIPYLLTEIERLKTQCDINATSFFDMRDQLKKAEAERDTYRAALQNWHEREGE